jgi:hypothetical protein
MLQIVGKLSTRSRRGACFRSLESSRRGVGGVHASATLVSKDEVMKESAPKDPEILEGNVRITSRNVL